MDNGDQFHTSDLGEASYLMAVGHACLEIRPVDGDPARYRFCFPSEAARAVEDFYRGAKVEAHRLLLMERKLKGRLFRRRDASKERT